MDDKMGLYIHIPFCSRKCDYCDFVSYSMDRKAQQLYLEALFTEIDMVKSQFVDKEFDSIFIGGGTPSIMYEGFFASLARKLYSSFHFSDDTEFTIEVNPSSFSREKFFEYVEAGVNRISVGVQCLDSNLLASHGRVQSVENIKETFSILRDSRFPNVSADIMIGLPGQSESMVMQTLKYLTKQNIKHLSVYALQIERHTVLYDKMRRGRVRPAKEEFITNMYEKITKNLKKFDFKRYELSNFAKPNFECRHNKKYWNGTEYLGLGVSAHSYIDGYRFYNTKRLDTYIDKMRDGKTAVYSKEYISQKDARTERIMLSLRTMQGLNLEEFKNEFDEDILKTRSSQITTFKDQGLIEIVDGYLRINENHFYVSNSIIVDLL